MFIYIILAVMEVPKELPTIEVTVPPGVISMTKYTNLERFEDVFNDDFSISTLMELYKKNETKTNKKSTISFFENDFEELLGVEIFLTKKLLKIEDDSVVKELLKKVALFFFSHKKTKNGKSTYQLNLSDKNITKNKENFLKFCSENNLVDVEKTFIDIFSIIFNINHLVIQVKKTLDLSAQIKKFSFNISVKKITSDSSDFHSIKDRNESHSSYILDYKHDMYEILNKDRLINQSITSFSFVKNPAHFSVENINNFFLNIQSFDVHLFQMNSEASYKIIQFISSLFNAENLKQRLKVVKKIAPGKDLSVGTVNKVCTCTLIFGGEEQKNNE